MGFLTLLGSIFAFTKSLWKKQTVKSHCLCGMIVLMLAVIHMIEAISKAGLFCYATYTGIISVVILALLTLNCMKRKRLQAGWKKKHIIYSVIFAASIIIHLLLLKC